MENYLDSIIRKPEKRLGLGAVPEENLLISMQSRITLRTPTTFELPDYTQPKVGIIRPEVQNYALPIAEPFKLEPPKITLMEQMRIDREKREFEEADNDPGCFNPRFYGGRKIYHLPPIMERALVNGNG